jgi:hypothetical protein
VTPDRGGGSGSWPEPTVKTQPSVEVDDSRAEVDLRLEAASELAAYAAIGLVEHDLAAAGVLGLISCARLHLKAVR